MAERRSFGNIRKLASSRWQAQYRWKGQGYTSDVTFSCPETGRCKKAGEIRREMDAGILAAKKAKAKLIEAGVDKEEIRRQMEPSIQAAKKAKAALIAACVGEGKCQGWKNADAELGRIRRELESGKFDPAAAKAEQDKPPEQEVPTVREYAEEWLERKRLYGRKGKPLEGNTLDGYRYNLNHHVLPAFGDHRLDEVDDEQVQAWFDRLLRNPDRPSARAHAYGTLVGLYHSAVRDKKVPAVRENPCQVEGGTHKERAKPEPREPSLDELATMVEATPAKFKLMLLMAAYCGLRFGELAELRRGDVDLTAGKIRVQRAVARPRSGPYVKKPKGNEKSSIRAVAVPEWMLDDLRAHLNEHAQPGPSGMLFPNYLGEHLSYTGRDLWWVPAREAAGRPDLTFHDLRHVAGNWYARGGATIKELMARLGHTTPQMAMRYQMVASERDREIANTLPRPGSNVIPIDSKRKAS